MGIFINIIDAEEQQETAYVSPYGNDTYRDGQEKNHIERLIKRMNAAPQLSSMDRNSMNRPLGSLIEVLHEEESIETNNATLIAKQTERRRPQDMYLSFIAR